MVFPPLRLPPPESIPEAHLYLSLSHQVGTSNHSIMYNAEWELLQSLLVDDILCQKCIEENAAEELTALQTSNEKEWEAKKVSKSVTHTGCLHMYTLIPLQKIFPQVSWQNLEHGPHHPHVQESMQDEKVPPTVKVNIAAKLFMPHNAHCAHEANNY